MLFKFPNFRTNPFQRLQSTPVCVSHSCHLPPSVDPVPTPMSQMVPGNPSNVPNTYTGRFVQFYIFSSVTSCLHSTDHASRRGSTLGRRADFETHSSYWKKKKKSSLTEREHLTTQTTWQTKKRRPMKPPDADERMQGMMMTMQMTH